MKNILLIIAACKETWFELALILFVILFTICWMLGYSSSMSVIAIGTLVVMLAGAIRELVRLIKDSPPIMQEVQNHVETVEKEGAAA